MAFQVIDAATPPQEAVPPEVATRHEAAGFVERTLQQAETLGEAGRHDEALALLLQTLHAHGRSADLHAARGWALENTEPPQWNEARAAYDTALALEAGHVWARIGLATTLAALGQAAAAQTMYEAAAQTAQVRTPLEPEMLEALGWCQYCLGRLDDAAATFQRALAIDPAWVSVHFDLGLVGLLRGDADPASHFQAALAVLARRGPACRVGALRVALDDIDAALPRCTAPAAQGQARQLRQQLLQALQEAARA